jgi:TRAP-type C4-dicarboxylate transport system substrate-binding protein
MRFQWILPYVAWAFLLSYLPAGTAWAEKFKIATVAPEGSGWMQSMRVAANEIKERTEGRVTIKFYAGGVMGNDKKVLRKMRIGQLQGGVFTANGLSDRYRDILIYGLPLLFRSQEEVDYVRERMDPILAAGLEEAGFVSFGFASGGFAKLMGQEPVSSFDDLRGRKVWVPEGDRISYEAMVALDLSPVVLPITDVLTGLQTGLLEYIATPPVGAILLQWYTKVKYVTPLPIAYTLGFMALDKRAFGRVNETDRKVMREVLEAVYERFDKLNQEDNLKAEKALAENGLKFVELSAEQLPQWRQATQRANEKMGQDGVFSPELLAQLQAYLEEYRKGAGLAQASSSFP